MTISLQALSLVEKAEPVQARFTLRSRDQQSIRMQDGCKAYMDSYTASNRSCFSVTCIIFKTHVLEVSLTQNRETTTLRTLTTIGLLCFTMSEDPHEQKFIEIEFGWGPGHIWLHTTPPEGPGPWPFYTTVEVCLRQPWGTFLLGSHDVMVTALGSRVKHWSGRFLGIIGWDPSVCKFNHLHVDILRYFFIKLGYIS